MLGLPDGIRACLFDMDGVLTRTATVHMAAWKRTFDEYLRAGDPQAPLFTQLDYNRYVDGKPRADGVRDFLASRGITLPEGTPDDPADAATVHGIGRRKNELLLAELAENGVEVYPGSLAYLRAARDAGLATAVVTASANGEQVIAAGGFADLIDARVDGLVTAREGLRGKPAPDTFLAGARALGVEPAEAAVFEDALAGVEAGRAGRFGHVVGVDRVGQAEALRAHGADVVVTDLDQLLDGGAR
ncbi:haloacid dehalogenase superfamily, subfamily IA, variant 3 with third motif having DD or ED/beta-phosphoglucomutase family hydrolase [Geodermatophilus dictyosporus]|uniref:Beta-phosphoglucomutase n=1 Tax=Geodermatophilus dictyosporus TaxID=1523247 RepID=A0A1I5JWP5_9ACTN|nr:beta-phosphoglucomutase family hydrolase [Geodermatophilus dictyosporus]SFO77224.1 haloacid dehalogenase superfamily, subfamily IA, variant 3 with third motif having DD or ED/beta-phosphoglucomutase family hydrolase [Geodermatophilus dictyosporus]